MFGKSSKEGEKKPDLAGLQKLAKTGEVQQLMGMLQKNGAVQEAAKSASTGDTAALMGMVQQLMSTSEGAELIGSIQKKAKEAGID